MTVYISGGISNVPDFKEKFKAAEKHIRGLGFNVINPAGLKDNVMVGDFGYADYMNICLFLLESADCVYMLNGWERSEGAKTERKSAEISMIPIVTEQEEREKGEMVWIKCY
nr:DUF4406 domain-containing protein [uncultured Catonella sp.]